MSEQAGTGCKLVTNQFKDVSSFNNTLSELTQTSRDHCRICGRGERDVPRFPAADPPHGDLDLGRFYSDP